MLVSFYRQWTQFARVEQPGYPALASRHFSTEILLRMPRKLPVCAVKLPVQSRSHPHSNYEQGISHPESLCQWTLALPCEKKDCGYALGWTRFFFHSPGDVKRQVCFAKYTYLHLIPTWYWSPVLSLASLRPRKKKKRQVNSTNHATNDSSYTATGNSCSLPQECMYMHVATENRPFPSCILPLFQNESKCKTFHMKMSKIVIWMNLWGKLSLIWKVSHLDSFWNRGKGNSEMAYSHMLSQETGHGTFRHVATGAHAYARCYRKFIHAVTGDPVTAHLRMLPQETLEGLFGWLIAALSTVEESNKGLSLI